MSEVMNETISLDAPEEEKTNIDLGAAEETESIRITADESAASEEGSEQANDLQMPDKFANAEDPNKALLQAYLELEKSKSKPADEPKDDTGSEEVQQQQTESMSIEQYQDSWAKQGGQLTEAQWDAVQKQTGVPMETLKAWETHVKNSVNDVIVDHDTNIYNEFGGEEKYNEMIDWADRNLSPEQIDALNAQLDSPQFYKQGASILKSAYLDKVGHEASVRLDDIATGPIDGGDEFMSEADVQEAMSHKDYGKGTKYDREFDKKLMRYMKRTGQA